MSNKRRLTKAQEQRRLDGLRLLARIIARHYLAHPELYPNSSGWARLAPAVNGPVTVGGDTAGKEDAE